MVHRDNLSFRILNFERAVLMTIEELSRGMLEMVSHPKSVTT